MESSGRWSKGLPSSRELDDAERITATPFLSRDPKCTPKSTIEFKMGIETENYEMAAKRFENNFRAKGFRDL